MPHTSASTSTWFCSVFPLFQRGWGLVDRSVSFSLVDAYVRSTIGDCFVRGWFVPKVQLEKVWLWVIRSTSRVLLPVPKCWMFLTPCIFFIFWMYGTVKIRIAKQDTHCVVVGACSMFIRGFQLRELPYSLLAKPRRPIVFLHELGFIDNRSGLDSIPQPSVNIVQCSLGRLGQIYSSGFLLCAVDSKQIETWNLKPEAYWCSIQFYVQVFEPDWYPIR